jgi:hypothetical protein
MQTVRNGCNASACMGVSELSTFLAVSGFKQDKNGRKRLRDAVQTGNGCNAERLGTFEAECINALERIVENVHRTFAFTL